MEKKEVWFNGVRSNTRKDKETKEDRTTHIADMYMPGMGGYDVVLTPEQYGRFYALQPGTKFHQHYRIEIKNEVRKGQFGDYAVRRPTVIFGDIELLEEPARGAKAS